jgi:hypothetical protein
LAKIYFTESDDLLDIRKDNVFKAVFTKDMPESRAALGKLVSALIGREVTINAIYANEPPIDNLNDRQIRFDIFCKAEDGELVNVEMCLNPNPQRTRRPKGRLPFPHTGKFPCAGTCHICFVNAASRGAIFCSPMSRFALHAGKLAKEKSEAVSVSYFFHFSLFIFHLLTGQSSGKTDKRNELRGAHACLKASYRYLTL